MMREYDGKRRLSTRLTALLLAGMLLMTAAPVALAVACEDGAHKATEGRDQVVAPTCAAGGYTEHLCSVCDETYRDKPTEPTGEHTYDDYFYNVEPRDDTNPGHNRKCTVCQLTETEPLQPHSYTTKVVAPTCTEDGYTRHSCVCGFYYDTDPVKASGHNFASSWMTNDTHHWHVCMNSGCAVKDAEGKHTVNTADWVVNEAENTRTGPCTVCRYEVTEDLRPLYTVTFKNGTTTVETQQLRAGETPAAVAEPKWTGAGTGTFLGWSESSGGVRSATVTPLTLSAYKAAKNVTLYAVYNVTVADKAVRVTLPDTAAYVFEKNLSGGSVLSLLNDAMKSAGSELTYVQFGAPRSTTYGALYTNSGKVALSTTVKYYYSSLQYGSEPLSKLYFVPAGSPGSYGVDYTAYDAYGNTVSGLLTLTVPTQSIRYEVKSSGTVQVSAADFNTFFRKSYSGYTPRYIIFETGTEFSAANGYLYYDYDGSNEKSFTNTTIDNDKFYYDSSTYGVYPIGGLTFKPGTSTSDHTVSVDFTAYYDQNRYVSGTLKFVVTYDASAGKVTYETDFGTEVDLEKTDFNTLFQKSYSGYSVRWVEFDAGTEFSSSKGYLYYDYGGSGEIRLTNAKADDYKYYYSSSTYGDYPMSGLSFVPGTSTSAYTASIGFTAYYSSTRYVTGTLTVKVTEGATAPELSILYKTTKGSAVVFNPYDFYALFQQSYPSYAMKYVVLAGVPSTGTLYYNYKGSSKYGATTSTRLTSANCDDNYFYYEPASTANYSLDELTYVPSGSNYCVSIPFKAVYSSTRTVTGTVVISVTGNNVVSNVYYAGTKGNKTAFNGVDFGTAVKNATGSVFSYVKFTALPAATQGTLYYKYTSASSYGHKVLAGREYSYSGGEYTLSNITFAPASGFTGSVELPYVAYDSFDDPVAAGKLYLGVVEKVKSYNDVTKAAWYYQYVLELSDDGVIGGYPDGSYRPSGSVTWGEALKLVMLSAGYKEQAQPAGKHWAYGYMTRAKADGLISADVALNTAITRQQVAALAAKALKLSAATVQSPFSDTNDGYVLALYRTGIVEGTMDSSGVRTYKPGNTITRAELSTIIWRINRKAN